MFAGFLRHHLSEALRGQLVNLFIDNVIQKTEKNWNTVVKAYRKLNLITVHFQVKRLKG